MSTDLSNPERASTPSAAIDERKQLPIILYVDVYPYRIDPGIGEVRFLVLKRRGEVQLGDTWQPASGKLRAGERISAAFSRMTQAKTGQRPARLWSLDTLNTFYDGYYDAVMMVPAAAAELVNEPVMLQDEYHCEYAWLTGDEARARLIWPNQRRCITEIEEALSSGLDEARYRFRRIRVPE